MKLMKLIETKENIFTTDGIFGAIYRISNFNWLTYSNVKQWDVDYYLGNSGNKQISPLYERLIEYQEKNYIKDALVELAKVVVNQYKDKWNRQYEVLILEYNPIENYNSTEIETNTSQSTNKVETSQKITNKVDDSNFGFNSVTGQPVSQTVSEVSGTGEDNNTSSEVKIDNSRILTRAGNIGVTTTQQMIESELKLRNKVFAEMVYKDIDTLLTNPVY